MRLPGYQRRGPDPMRPGVMAPPDRIPDAILTLPRVRRHPLCLIRHKRDYIRLRAAGETWATFIYICRRCNRLLGNSHAARAETPVTSNK